MSTPKKMAVVLCGSGFKDGSEIRESVFTLLSLSQRKVEFKCFAPDEMQRDVVNCLTGEIVKGESRNMLVEAARIARGDVLPLSQLDVSNYDGIILPGGFGAAKNLCDYALKGCESDVRWELKVLLKSFYEQKKPIGAICIAPLIIGLSFKGQNFHLTLGPQSKASEDLQTLGHTHHLCPVSDCVVDTQNKIVSTPAYMEDCASMAEVFKGIDRLVEEILKM